MDFSKKEEKIIMENSVHKLYFCAAVALCDDRKRTIINHNRKKAFLLSLNQPMYSTQNRFLKNRLYT
jgi:hypothetical protein